MKVTIQNKKGLSKDLKVFIDKKTINDYVDQKYEEIKKDVVLKGFRPGKVPKQILQRQFGKAVFGDVLDKILKDTSVKALEEQKIKPAGQPKINLKKFGENEDLEYIISVTEIPKIDIKEIEKIKFTEYEIKIEDKETDKRIKEIAKNQKNFVEVDDAKVANEGDLVVFDYKAAIDGKIFKGNEGKNTQLEIGKDLFIKGFDKQLLKCKKKDIVEVKVPLPENFPEKELVGKTANFVCTINSVKKAKDVEINDEFAKNLGAKDLDDLKKLIKKQINDQYKNSLELLTKNNILEEINKINIQEIPKNLLEDEMKILSQGIKEEDLIKQKKSIEKNAIKRIKAGLILNEFGEKNNIKVDQKEIENEIQKQISMMPGQEKIVMDYYKNNPAALSNIRGSLYEEKIISQIKLKAKATKKIVSKHEAEEILKSENKKQIDLNKKETTPIENKAKKEKEKTLIKSKPKPSKSKKIKKVSKK